MFLYEYDYPDNKLRTSNIIFFTQIMLTSDSENIEEQVYSVKTIKEFLERLQQHEISTASKFVVVKSCKKFSQDKAVLSDKLKLHWQDEIPYFHFGARLYLCHQGKDNNKYQKKKYANNRDKKADHFPVKRYNFIKSTKKLDCPAFVRVTRIVKILEHRVTEPITNHRKGIISNLIKKKISESKLIGEECYIFNLPGVEEHKFHVLGAEATAIEPVDRRVKEYILELAYNGEKDLTSISKKLIDFVENELNEYDRTRRRFYPDLKTLRKCIARARNNMDKNIVSQMSRVVDHEIDSSSENPHTQSSESFSVELKACEIGNSLKNNLIQECNLSIQSIISSFEILDEASLQSLSRALKDINNEISSCRMQKTEVVELNSEIKSETLVQSVPVLMHNSIFIPQTDLENGCVVHLAPELISSSLLHVNSGLTKSNFINQTIGNSTDS